MPKPLRCDTFPCSAFEKSTSCVCLEQVQRCLPARFPHSRLFHFSSLSLSSSYRLSIKLASFTIYDPSSRERSWLASNNTQSLVWAPQRKASTSRHSAHSPCLFPLRSKGGGSGNFVSCPQCPPTSVMDRSTMWECSAGSSLLSTSHNLHFSINHFQSIEGARLVLFLSRWEIRKSNDLLGDKTASIFIHMEA